MLVASPLSCCPKQTFGLRLRLNQPTARTGRFVRSPYRRNIRASPNGIYGISGSEGSASFWLDIGGLYYPAPFLGFVGDKLAELGRRSRQRRAAEVSKTGLHLRVVESRVDLLVELVDDLGRRGPRYAEAVPITHLVARQELTYRRDVRQRVRARRGGYCERSSLPALMYSMDAGIVGKLTCTCPARRSVRVGPAPR